MYSEIYQTIIFPFYESVLRQRKTLKYLKEMERNQWLPAEVLREIQWRRLKALIAHAQEVVPFYKDLFKGRGISPHDIKSPADLNLLPVLTRKVINANTEQMVAPPYRGRLIPKATSGSIGEPLRFYITRESYERRIAARVRAYAWAGHRDGEKTFYLWGPSVIPNPILSRAKEGLHNFLLRRRTFNVYDLSEDRMEKFLARLNSFRPKFIVGYTTALYNFAQFINGRRLHFQPRAIFPVGEQLFPHQRRMLEEVFQSPVFNSYGSREFMLIAAECEEHQGLHLSAENLYVEFLKDGRPLEEEDVGEIVITDLHNYGMPFIRYTIEDLGVPSGKICDCGRGLPLIEKVEGRSLDFIRGTGGRLIAGNYFSHIMSEYPGVRKFQVVQEEDSEVRVRIVRNEDFTPDTYKAIRRKIRELLGEETPLTIEFLNDIPYEASGKFRWIRGPKQYIPSDEEE